MGEEVLWQLPNLHHLLTIPGYKLHSGHKLEDAHSLIALESLVERPFLRVC